MVEVVVVGAVNRVPGEDDGGAFESVGEIGGGEGDIHGRLGGAHFCDGRASYVVAGCYPVVVASVGGGVRVGCLDEVGGQLVADAGRAVGLHIAVGGEGVVMVEIVVVGIVNRVPVDDDGGAFVSVGEVGGGGGGNRGPVCRECRQVDWRHSRRREVNNRCCCRR